MKTIPNTFLQRGICAWVLFGLLGSGLVAEAWAERESRSTVSGLIAQTEQLGKQIFKRKNGEVLTFQQIRVLPSKERGIVLDEEMSEVEFEKFDKYTESRTSAAKAQLEETKKGLAAAEAEGKRLDKELAASDERIAKHMEALAAKSRKELASGEKLSISFKTFSQFVTSIDDGTLKAGLSKESANLLKSLLQRPELFEKE